MWYQAAGWGSCGVLGGRLVQLHPGQDAHRVQQSDEGEEPDQPGQHPWPGPQGGLWEVTQPVQGVCECELSSTLLQNLWETVGGIV